MIFPVRLAINAISINIPGRTGFHEIEPLLLNALTHWVIIVLNKIVMIKTKNAMISPMTKPIRTFATICPTDVLFGSVVSLSNHHMLIQYWGNRSKEEFYIQWRKYTKKNTKKQIALFMRGNHRSKDLQEDQVVIFIRWYKPTMGDEKTKLPR